MQKNDINKKTLIREARASLQKDTSPENKKKQAQLLGKNKVKLSEYDNVIKADLAKERNKKLGQSKGHSKEKGLSL